MGIYDREYYRDDRPRFSAADVQRSIVMILLITNVVIYFVNVFLTNGQLNLKLLAVHPDTLVKPWLWWTFVTYGFAHDTQNMVHLVFNMVGLFFFGRDVEAVYGRNPFLRFYLTALVLGSVLWAGRIVLSEGLVSGPSLIGASGAITAIVVLFALHFPNRTVLLMFVIPMPAWVLGVFLVISNLINMHSSVGEGGPQIAYDVHLIGAAFGFLYFRYRLDVARLWPGRISWRSLKPKPRLRVHSPDDRYEELDRRADRILEKVHRDGAGSITAEEQRILEDYSRRMRQKHG